MSFKTTHLMFTARGVQPQPAGQSLPWIRHAIRGHVERSLLDREIDDKVVEHCTDSTYYRQCNNEPYQFFQCIRLLYFGHVPILQVYSFQVQSLINVVFNGDQ